jgi:cyclophilin family peptidyl-prolyl cis-trans isomerase
MKQIMQEFPNDVHFVYRFFPLIGTPDSPFHDKAALSMQAAEAAGKQGSFWQMHDILYSRQSDWSSLSIDEFQQWLIERAGELNLDLKQFTTDLTSQELVDLAQTAWDDGRTQLGLSGTPTLYVDGHPWTSSTPMDHYSISTIIRLELLAYNQFTECPPMTINTTKQYIATLHTVKGDIVIELYADKAPVTVNSFIFLAQHGWFDGVTFHRVLTGKLAQTGDPSGTGYGTPGYAFINEISPDLSYNGPGVVGMANSGADSNGSQFFITETALPDLNGSYTIFGHVIQGMDVVNDLTPRDPSQNGELLPGDEIVSVSIEEK